VYNDYTYHWNGVLPVNPSSGGGTSVSGGGANGVGGSANAPGVSGGSGSGGGTTGSGGGSTSNGWLIPQWDSCIVNYWDPDNPGDAIFENNCSLVNPMVWVIRSDGFPEGYVAGINYPGWISQPVTIDLPGDDYGYSVYVCPGGYQPVDSSGSLVSQPTVTQYFCKPNN
jgi:hypothetical protein